MKNLFQLKSLVLPLAGSLMLLSSCNQAPPPAENQPAEPNETELAKRGEYLVEIMGCHDCHSPKVFGPQGPTLDTERLLSGHPADIPFGEYDPKVVANGRMIANEMITAFAGPWGISYAANLTSDAAGIGNWTYEQFSKAVREGKYKGLDGSRPLLPPMPWFNLVNITDDDLKAIFTFLKSTKPIPNVVPSPTPPPGV
jgi:hypothetical protein